MKEKFSLEKFPVPAVWQKRELAGDFTILTDYPDNWEPFKTKLRRDLWKLLGTRYRKTLPLASEVLNTRTHCGVTVQNLIYQTRPGIWTTATLYLPEGKGPFPGVVNLHGHRLQGRLDASIQSRGFALAKTGYAVLSPDTFGLGERTTRHGEFEHHGRLLGSALFNTEETLLGCILVDNMRAVDMLLALPQVDKNNIGATGGGSQTLYLAAMDERIKAAVPVCCVGSFASYLSETTCVCETLPGGLKITEMAGILALAAPRAMMICSGLTDAKPFSPREMLNTFNAALPVYKKFNAGDNFTYRIFNPDHACYKEVREAMLGFFELHLKGKGHGLPVEEPSYTTLPAKELMAFAPGTRPAKVRSLEEHIRQKCGEYLNEHYTREWFDPDMTRASFSDALKPDKTLRISRTTELTCVNGWRRFQLELSNGVILPLVIYPGKKGITLFTHVSGKDQVPAEEIEKAVNSGKTTVLADLSEQAENAEQPEAVMPFHQTGNRHLWLGRNLMAEWTAELCVVSVFLAKLYHWEKLTIHAWRETAVASLFATLFSGRIHHVRMQEAFVTSAFTKQGDFFGMAAFVPGILKWGDIPLAAALSPAEIEWIDPRDSDGTPVRIPEKEIASFKDRSTFKNR